MSVSSIPDDDDPSVEGASGAGAAALESDDAAATTAAAFTTAAAAAAVAATDDVDVEAEERGAEEDVGSGSTAWPAFLRILELSRGLSLNARKEKMGTGNLGTSLHGDGSIGWKKFWNRPITMQACGCWYQSCQYPLFPGSGLPVFNSSFLG